MATEEYKYCCTGCGKGDKLYACVKYEILSDGSVYNNDFMPDTDNVGTDDICGVYHYQCDNCGNLSEDKEEVITTVQQFKIDHRDRQIDSIIID